VPGRRPPQLRWAFSRRGRPTVASRESIRRGGVPYRGHKRSTCGRNGVTSRRRQMESTLTIRLRLAQPDAAGFELNGNSDRGGASFAPPRRPRRLTYACVDRDRHPAMVRRVPGTPRRRDPGYPRSPALCGGAARDQPKVWWLASLLESRARRDEADVEALAALTGASARSRRSAAASPRSSRGFMTSARLFTESRCPATSSRRRSSAA